MIDKISLPVSIVLAGGLVGVGFYLSRTRGSLTPLPVREAVSQSKSIRPVGAEDHILGNPKARVMVIEYSDPECPFCKQFHSTMRQIIGSYGSQGEVAWVYRHFPLEEIHSKAPREAQALECAAKVGGNSKFWEYTNRLYEITPSNNNLPDSSLYDIAKQVSLSSPEFKTCLDNKETETKVNADIENARDSGGDGTPYSVILDTKTGDSYPMPGAQSYSTVKGVVDLILGS